MRLLLTLLLLAAPGCDSKTEGKVEFGAEYSNPVVTPVAADPTLIRAGDRFYLFATNDDWGDGHK